MHMAYLLTIGLYLQCLWSFSNAKKILKDNCNNNVMTGCESMLIRAHCETNPLGFYMISSAISSRNVSSCLPENLLVRCSMGLVLSYEAIYFQQGFTIFGKCIILVGLRYKLPIFRFLTTNYIHSCFAWIYSLLWSVLVQRCKKIK